VHSFSPSWQRCGSRSKGLDEKADLVNRQSISSEEESRKEITMSNAGVAAVLSLVVPGVGQIFNGDFVRGAFWLVVTPGLWIGSGGVVGGACHLVSAYTAYHRAKLKEQADSRSKGASAESVTIECISPCPAQ